MDKKRNKKDKVMKKILELHGRALENPHLAGEIFSAYEAPNAGNWVFFQAWGASLIDGGSNVQDADLIREGIEKMEHALGLCPSKHKALLHFNLGNGHCGLHDVERRSRNFPNCYNPANTPLLQAKRHFREALKMSPNLDKRTRTELRVNYGNCLSGLGRTLEAIYEYEAALAEDSRHPMAWGNLGIELQYFANISRYAHTLVDAREALQKSLSPGLLTEYSYQSQHDLFRDSLNEIVQRMDEQKTPSMANAPSSVETINDPYSDFCKKNRLFLNFTLKSLPCGHSEMDTLHIDRPRYSVNNNDPDRALKILNEIKERYVIARLLLYEACNPSPSVEKQEAMTEYSEFEDDLVCGVSSGKLKTAYECAFNLLDKIAAIVNHVWDLQMKEDAVYFTNVWGSTTAINGRIRSLNNFFLFALYDIYLDLAKNGSHDYLRKLRHALTHRYLVLTGGKGSGKGHEFSGDRIGIDEFRELTFEIMHISKSSLIYLIAALRNELFEDPFGRMIIVPVIPPDGTE